MFAVPPFITELATEFGLVIEQLRVLPSRLNVDTTNPRWFHLDTPTGSRPRTMAIYGSIQIVFTCSRFGP